PGPALTIVASINGKLVTSSQPTLTVVDMIPSLSNSTITVSAPTATAGTRVPVILQLRDSLGNNLDLDGLEVKFHQVGSLRGNFGPLRFQGGTYVDWYSAVQAGSFAIGATVGGQEVTSSLPTITIVPSALSVRNSTIT